MDLKTVEERLERLEADLKRTEALLLRQQGAIAVLKELLAQGAEGDE